MHKHYCNRLLLRLLLYSSSGPSVLSNVKCCSLFRSFYTYRMLKDKLYSNDRRTRRRDREPSGCSVLRFVSRHASCNKHHYFFYTCCISASARNNSLNMVNEILNAIHGTTTRGPPLTANRKYGEPFCAYRQAKSSE